jgi:hypothetical protein
MAVCLPRPGYKVNNAVVLIARARRPFLERAAPGPAQHQAPIAERGSRFRDERDSTLKGFSGQHRIAAVEGR